MSTRILMTGIPSHYSRLINYACGKNIHYTERLGRPAIKHEFMRELSSIRNTGNYLIGEGTMQCLRSGATHIPFWHLSNNIKDDDFFQEMRDSFDVVVFSAANLLRSDLDAVMEADVLERLGMPTVLLGLGIQRRDDLQGTLPPGTQRLLELFKSPQNFVLTRGIETASFLRQHGVPNVQPAGCPSLYLNPSNMVRALERLPHVTFGGSERLAFLGQLGASGDAMMDMNALTPSGTTCSYIIQDEPLIFDMQIEGNDDDTVYDHASGQIVAPVEFPERSYLQRDLDLYCFFDTSQWRVWNSRLDFCFSRRFHGAVSAMQAGIPAAMVCIDDRMLEMATFAGLPYLPRESWNCESDKAAALRSFLAETDVSKAVDVYSKNEEAFRAVLSKLGLS